MSIFLVCGNYWVKATTINPGLSKFIQLKWHFVSLYSIHIPVCLCYISYLEVDIVQYLTQCFCFEPPAGGASLWARTLILQRLDGAEITRRAGEACAGEEEGLWFIPFFSPNDPTGLITRYACRCRRSFINIVDRRRSADERSFAAVHNRLILSLRSCQPAARSFMSVSRLVCAWAPARAHSLRLMPLNESGWSRVSYNRADSYFPAAVLLEKFGLWLKCTTSEEPDLSRCLNKLIGKWVDPIGFWWGTSKNAKLG